jgi:uncharacterized protein with FMN-binding domain
LIIIVALVAGYLFLIFNRGMGTIRALDIGGVDLSRIDDGTYTGRYSHGRWGYTVEVTVADHRIENVEITECTKADIYVELNAKLVSYVVGKQTLEYDAVGGASISSKAFLKAVENALAHQ